MSSDELIIKKTLLFPLLIGMILSFVFLLASDLLFSSAWEMLVIDIDVKWFQLGMLLFFLLFFLIVFKSKNTAIVVDKHSIKEENLKSGAVYKEILLTDVKRIYKETRQIRTSGEAGERSNRLLLIIESIDGREVALDRLLYKPDDLSKLRFFMIQHASHIKDECNNR